MLGPIFFQQKPLTYIMLMLAVGIYWMLFYTQWGLRMRAVGEHPRGRHAGHQRLPHALHQHVGGAALMQGWAARGSRSKRWTCSTPLMTNGLGFIGLAAMIFGKWSPLGALIGALIFGLGNSVTSTISIFRPDIPSQIPQMLPYLLTIIVLTGVVGRAIPPAADGQPYEKH